MSILKKILHLNKHIIHNHQKQSSALYCLYFKGKNTDANLLRHVHTNSLFEEIKASFAFQNYTKLKHDRKSQNKG